MAGPIVQSLLFATGVLTGAVLGLARSPADLRAIDRDAALACELRAEGECAAELERAREANASCAWAVAEMARTTDGCRAFLRLPVEP